MEYINIVARYEYRKTNCVYNTSLLRRPLATGREAYQRALLLATAAAANAAVTVEIGINSVRCCENC